MNRQELLKDLSARDWCDALVTAPELREKKPNGDKWYMVNVREVSGRAATYRNVHFYVVAEGTKNEVAYYKDGEPQPLITEPTPEE